MCEAVHHSHTGLRVSTNFQGGNFLTKWRFQRNVAFSHLASRDARRRTLCVPFGTTQEEFSFDIQQQVLLPALSSYNDNSHNGRFKSGRHDLAVLLRSGRRIFTSAAPSCSFIRSGRSAAACAFSRFFHDATPRMRGHKTPRGFNHLHADRRSMRINLKCALLHDHILHCGCTRRFIRGTLSPASKLQCDVHWCTRFRVA